MKKENKSQYAILSFLSKHPLSGYGIKQLAERLAPFHWSEANAQIYPILKQLEQQGFVTSEIDPSSGKRRKCVYSITAAGRNYLQHWLEQPVDLQKERNELLLKLCTGSQTTPEVLIQHLENYALIIQQRQRLLKGIAEHIQTAHEDKPEQPYLLMTYDYNQRLLDMQQQWCEATLEKLRKTNALVQPPN